MDPDRLAGLEERLAYHFRDRRLLEQALTHPSFTEGRQPPAPDLDRLAFLGDAALALIVAERLFTAEPGAPVGVLTPQRAALVSGANLARWATQLDLGSLVRLGRGEAQTGGRSRESILATALEALLGAIYLESGLAEVRRVVARLALW